MLLFLSVFNKDKNSDQLIDNTYDGPDDFKCDGRHTNEPAVRYVISKTGGIDKLFVFTTEAVLKKISYMEAGKQHSSKSQLWLFSKELADLDAKLYSKIESVEYDNQGESNSSFKSVLDMAEKIRQYLLIEKEAGNNILLDVDMTGGMRDASMLMLAVIQVLKYCGVYVEQVIYTNYDGKAHHGTVTDATSVHDIYQLVAGAEAFVRYGSVDVLEDYFMGAAKISASLKMLLAAMHTVSDVLKICRSGLIKEALKKLSKAIMRFNKTHGGSMEEQLFAQLMQRIEQEYKPIISSRTTNLDIIEWCLNKGFLQQAMTFSTELLPEYIVAKKYLYFLDLKEEKKCKRQPRTYEPWQKHLLTHYKYISELEQERRKNIRSNGIITRKEAYALREYVLSDTTKRAAFKSELHNWFSNADAIEEFLVKFPKTFANLQVQLLKQNITLEQIAETYPEIWKVANFNFERVKTLINNPYTGTAVDYWLGMANPNMELRKFASSAGKEKFMEIFGAFFLEEKQNFNNGESDIQQSDSKEKILEKYEIRLTFLKEYLQKNILKSEISFEQLSTIIKAYYEITQMRNNINHAGMDNNGVITIDNIKSELRNTIDFLKSIDR